MRVCAKRRGAVAVEAALLLPFMLLLMVGVWEVGRLLQVQQVVSNAAREGARAAAGGTMNGEGVTVSMVQDVARDHLRGAGLPDAAVTGAEITLTNLSANSWTDPVDAEPLDQFRVTVTIPAGPAFGSLKMSLVDQITTTTELSASVVWQSANDHQVVVDTEIPY